MNAVFSNHFVRNGAAVNFHGLALPEQHQALESNAQLSILLYALQCGRHPEFTLSVHITFNDGQLQNTIFCCCCACREEIELALLPSTFPAVCHCMGGRQRNKVKVSAWELFS